MSGWLLRHHRRILGVFALLALASVAALVRPGMRDEYSIEAFVASDDPEYDRYLAFMRQFVSNEIAVIAVQAEDIFAPAVLAMMHELVEESRALSGVQRVSAVSELPDLSAGQDGPLALARQLFDARSVYESVLAEPARGAAIREALVREPLVADNLLSRDGRTAAILIQVAGEHASGRQRKTLADSIRALVERAARAHSAVQLVVAGPAVTTVDMIDHLHRDLRLFTGVIVALISGTLFVVFRRWRPVVLPAAVAAVAVLCTLGLSIALHMTMSLIAQIVVILTSILAVANLVHIMVAHEEARGADGRAGSLETMRRMIGPTFAACATTAAGFGSIGLATLLPFRSFALLMAVGVMIGWLLGLCCVPLLDRVRRRAQAAARDEVGAWLLRAVHTSQSHRALTLAGFAALTVVCLIGARRIRFESNFLLNFRADSEIRRAYDLISGSLAPVGSMEVVVSGGEGGNIVTPAVLAELAAFSAEVVEAYPAVRKAMSLAELCRVGGLPLPESALGLTARLALLERLFGADMLANFVSADRSAVRVNLRAREGLQVREKLRMAEEIAERARGRFGEGYRVEVTGIYPFYAVLIAGLLRDQNVCFGAAAVLVLALIWASIRSLALATICMVPNLLPLAFCVGVMGWFGIPVNMATAMILSVAIGIAVDSAVHYAWRYRREVRGGRTPEEAVEITHATVGRACVFTQVIVVGGFWVLMFSEFLPTAYFGGLIGVAMIGALACDLLLLPMMLLFFRPRVAAA